MLVGIILVVLFLSVLILLHEAGHFFAAKKFGVFVEEFGIGLPPKIFGKKIGETIYSINALPVGGFVKILGEDGDTVGDPEIEIAQVETTEETTVSSEGIEIRETIVEKDVRIAGRKSLLDLPIWKRAVILSAGVFLNFIFGWILFSAALMIGTPKSLIIAGVAGSSPAESAGIETGDRVIAASAKDEILKGDIKAQEFTSFVGRHRGEEIDLEIGTESGSRAISVSPRLNPPEGEGALGVALVDAGSDKVPFPTNIWQGFISSAITVKEVYISVFNMIAGIFHGRSPLEQVTGPIGIVKTASASRMLGFSYLVSLLALISLNLAALNFFPFPALDGGRIIFLIIEKIKGSPLPKKAENYVNAAGMIVLLLFMLLVSIKDVLAII